MAAVFCPRCFPDGVMYGGPVVWKLCRSCAAAEGAEYGQGRFDAVDSADFRKAADARLRARR